MMVLIDFSLTDVLKVPVEKYQWYFIPEGTTTAITVDSDSYNEYKVKEVAQSGQYYCYVETVLADSDISVHFLTNQATVTITYDGFSGDGNENYIGGHNYIRSYSLQTVWRRFSYTDLYRSI